MHKKKRAAAGSDAHHQRNHEVETMELPLFPLNLVLFPGMVLPLHIFEPRYREMVNWCIAEKHPFGVVLIDEDAPLSMTASPHLIGTAARIERLEQMEDGRLNITTVGAARFRVKELHYDHSYLTGTVELFPVINGDTKTANELAHKLRPRLVEYVELLAKASNMRLQLDRLPEEPLTLAFLVGIALQIDNKHKQALLALPGVPEMLARELHLLSRELLLLTYMIDTQAEMEAMTSGPTGYIFPN